MIRTTTLLFAVLFPFLAFGITEPPVIQINPIVGSWSFTLPNAKCTETYHFFPNGTTKVTSGEEVSESVYEISANPRISGYYKLVDTIVKNNGKKDCVGGVTAIGHKATSFVRFHPSGQMLIICWEESLEKCFGPLKRINE